MNRQNQANDSASLPWRRDQQDQQEQENEQQVLHPHQSHVQLQLPQEPLVDSPSGQSEVFRIPAQHTGARSGLSDALMFRELQHLMALGQYRSSQPASLLFGASAHASPQWPCTYPNQSADVPAFLRRLNASRETPTTVVHQESVFQPQPMHRQAALQPAQQPLDHQMLFRALQLGILHPHNPQPSSRAELIGSQSAQNEQLLLGLGMMQQLARREQHRAFFNNHLSSVILSGATQAQLPSLYSLNNWPSSLSHQLLPTPLSQLRHDQQRPQLMGDAATNEECTKPASLSPSSAPVPSSQFDREQNSPHGLIRNKLTACGSVSVAMPLDQVYLSPYQAFIRQHLELFASDHGDCVTSQQGRRRRVKVGQVGIRCRHCSHFPLSQRGRGSCYYPQKLICVYQAAQNIASTHLAKSCYCLPANVRTDLAALHRRKDTASGWKSGGTGKAYWAEACLTLGLVDAEDGTIRFGKL